MRRGRPPAELRAIDGFEHQNLHKFDERAQVGVERSMTRRTIGEHPCGTAAASSQGVVMGTDQFAVNIPSLTAGQYDIVYNLFSLVIASMLFTALYLAMSQRRVAPFTSAVRSLGKGD